MANEYAHIANHNAMSMCCDLLLKILIHAMIITISILHYLPPKLFYGWSILHPSYNHIIPYKTKNITSNNMIWWPFSLYSYLHTDHHFIFTYISIACPNLLCPTSLSPSSSSSPSSCTRLALIGNSLPESYLYLLIVIIIIVVFLQEYTWRLLMLQSLAW